MGACFSSTGIDVSEEDRRLHREAEKNLKEVRIPVPPLYHAELTRSLCSPTLLQAKAKMAHQVKVRLPRICPLMHVCTNWVYAHHRSFYWVPVTLESRPS